MAATAWLAPVGQATPPATTVPESCARRTELVWQPAAYEPARSIKPPASAKSPFLRPWLTSRPSPRLWLRMIVRTWYLATVRRL